MEDPKDPLLEIPPVPPGYVRRMPRHHTPEQLAEMQRNFREAIELDRVEREEYLKRKREGD